jgi:hypothetical protein
LKPIVPLSILLVATALAGCLGSVNEGSDEPLDEGTAGPVIVPAQEVTPITGDPLPMDGPMHDHADPAQHAVEVNMELLAHPLPEPSDQVHRWNPAIPLGLDIRFGELDVKGDWLAQCSRDADGAYLWNIAIRDQPVLASRLPDAGNCADIKLTDDANSAVLGGNKLYDLRDKSNARLVR